MHDHQQIVDRIKAFVAGADQTRNEAVADLASNYSSACRDANDRLRRCGDYLRRGLRSEAIQLAECHPSLLDTIATLDMGELDDWEQLCAGYELARSERMMIEVAQELNEAYAQEQAIHDLLVKHRTLALRRAPLAERVAVLRELTLADPMTAHWGDDQEVLERAWLPAFRAEVASAVKAKDSAAIQRLAVAADPAVWRVAIPADIRQALDRAATAAQAELTVAELAALVPRVRAALQAGSYPDAKRVQAKWDKIVKQRQVPVPPELVDEVAPLTTWLAEQERLIELEAAQAEACERLRAILDVNVTLPDIRARYREVTALGLPVPPDVEADYLRAVRRLEKGKRMERLGIAVGVGVVVLIVVIVIVVMAVKSGSHG
jgi:hypothetical protein